MERSTAHPTPARVDVPQVGEDTAADHSEQGRRRVWFWLKVVVSVALLGYLTQRYEVDRLSSLLTSAIGGWVVVAVALYLGSHVLNAVRWYRYASELGWAAQRESVLRLYFLGLFVNLFAPGTIAGDIARAFGAGGEGSRASALAGVLAHRLTGLVALLLLAGTAALSQRELPLSSAEMAAVGAVPALAGTLLMIAPALASWIGATSGRELAVPKNWVPATLRTMPLAVAYHALQIGAVVCLARGLSLGVSTATLMFFVPIANVAGMIPVTVSGIGVREAVYVFLLGEVGVDAGRSLALGLLGSGLVLIAGLSGTPAFLTRRSTNSRRVPD